MKRSLFSTFRDEGYRLEKAGEQCRVVGKSCKDMDRRELMLVIGKLTEELDRHKEMYNAEAELNTQIDDAIADVQTDAEGDRNRGVWAKLMKNFKSGDRHGSKKES
jgi:hypothetical protein